MSQGTLNRNRWPRGAAVGTVFGAVMACGLAAADPKADKDDAAHRVRTDTPIKHLIVLIGENRNLRPYLCHLPTQARPIDRQPSVRGHHS
jgi:hypothetical protein